MKWFKLKVPLTLLAAGFLTVLLASCGTREEIAATGIAAEETQPSVTEVMPTETATVVPTKTPTPTAEPTSTPEPTPTPEPISALDEEIQQDVIQEFMARPENQQYGSFKQYVEGISNHPRYKRPDGMGGWGGENETLFDLQLYGAVVGYRDIPAAGIRGAPGEVFKTAFIASPEVPDILIPVTFAVKKNGEWYLLKDMDEAVGPGNGQYIVITRHPEQYTDYYWPPKEIIELDVDMTLDEWAEATIGKIVIIRIKVVWRHEGDWKTETIPFYHSVAIPMLSMPESYLRRYVGRHEELGVSTESIVSWLDLEILVNRLDPKLDQTGFIGTFHVISY